MAKSPASTSGAAPNPPPPTNGNDAPTIGPLNARPLMLAGVAVFVFAGVCAVLFLLATSLFDLDMDTWVRLRTMELFAMIAAIGIVVAVISKTDNAFAIIFGLLLIGALIVPTKDMVSLALLASGRESVDQSPVNQYDDGSEFRGRTSDLANKIIEELMRTPKRARDTESGTILESGDMDDKALQQARLALTRTIQAERRLSHLERARLGGYLPMLLSFAGEGGESQFQEYYFRHGREEAFLQDLVSLRSQELIQFSYSDFSSATIAPLGREVVCDYHQIIASDLGACPFRDIVSQREEEGRDLLDTDITTDQTITPFPSPRDRALRLCSANGPENWEQLTGDLQANVDVPHIAYIDVSGDLDFDEVTMDLRQHPEVSSDPYAVVVLRALGGNASSEPSCQVVGEDDDGGSFRRGVGLDEEWAARWDSYLTVRLDELPLPRGPDTEAELLFVSLELGSAGDEELGDGPLMELAVTLGPTGRPDPDGFDQLEEPVVEPAPEEPVVPAE